MNNSIVKKSILAGSLAVAASVVGYFEGRSLAGYLDPVGIPTICYGHTATAKIGQAKTAEECEQLLQQDLGKALAAVDRELPGLPPETRAALGSFVFNVGEGAFRSSTLLKKARAGDIGGACHELTRWVYAGGRVLNGLVRRRDAEKELCLIGVEHDKSTGSGFSGSYRTGHHLVLKVGCEERGDCQGFGRITGAASRISPTFTTTAGAS